MYLMYFADWIHLVECERDDQNDGGCIYLLFISNG